MGGIRSAQFGRAENETPPASAGGKIPEGDVMAGKKKPPDSAGKNISGKSNGHKKSVPVGRTLKTQDRYLPYKKNKVQELKPHRWVVVIDKNTDEEFAVVRLTDENQPNTTYLPTYKKGNRKKTYFKHFVRRRTTRVRRFVWMGKNSSRTK